MTRYTRFLILIIAVLLSVTVFLSCSEGDDPALDPDPVPFEFKDNLSEYGFFTGNLKDLQPADDVFPYELATPLFSDYTVKDRFIRLPAGKSIGYAPEGIVDFPDGTNIIKNFSSLDVAGGIVRLETRILVLDPYDGEWKVMIYLWNDAQTDAVKHIIGKTLNITVRNDAGDLISTNYKVPNTNECKRCHSSSGTTVPIGPKIRNLNYKPAGAASNQLDQWSSEGILTGLPGSGVPQLPDWTDEVHFTLDQRARAYLDINCAHCHTPGGDAFYTGFWLDYEETDSTTIGIYKTPVAAGPGAGTLTYDIVPGNADQSIVIYRMNSNAAGVAMPEIARSVVHTDGVQLIRDWINSL